jgi:hypothetical protein
MQWIAGWKPSSHPAMTSWELVYFSWLWGRHCLEGTSNSSRFATSTPHTTLLLWDCFSKLRSLLLRNLTFPLHNSCRSFEGCTNVYKHIVSSKYIMVVFPFLLWVLPVCCCARCAQELLNYYASFCVWVETGLMVSACTLNPVRAAVQSSLYAEPQRYGKIGPQTFSLDFKCARAAQSIYSPSSMCFLQIVLLVRYPLSVIQAFGTSLTTLFWTWSEYLGQNAFRMFCPTYIRCSQKDDNRSPD